MIKFFRHIRRSLINENRMGKYFKYAVGEIILVVIGILIALQINNWNENKKNRESWTTYNTSLIRDLQQDTITINSMLRFIDDDKIYQEKLLNRLSSKDVTKDTLVHIARYDIRINGRAYRPPNDKTFLAMQANGTVELFDNETYLLLLELQNRQAIAGSVIKANMNIFITAAEKYISQHSFNEFNPVSGPLLEKSWRDVDETELYKNVQGFLTVKSMVSTNTRIHYKQVLDLTEKVLNKLMQDKE